MVNDLAPEACARPKMAATHILRVLALAALMGMSILALVMGVEIAQQSQSGPGRPPVYVILALAVSSTSIVALLPIALLQILKPGCSLFYVWFELTWTLLLGSAWFALAVVQALIQDEDHSLTSYLDRPTLAARFTALQSAAFLSWALLWSWGLWVAVLAIRAWRSGQPRILQCPSRQVKFLEIKPVLVVDRTQQRRPSTDSEKSTASNPPR